MKEAKLDREARAFMGAPGGADAPVPTPAFNFAKSNVEDMLNTIQCGDATRILRQLPDQCADLIITSPPYFQQRRYNGHALGIGQESSPKHYLDALLDTFEECVRVVKPTGSIVYNIGDKYIDSSLSLIPFRFAIMACEFFGVKLVNEITWVKRNPTPRQFDRRLVSSTEPFFHFAVSGKYYYDRTNFLRGEDVKKPTPGKNVGQRYFELIRESDTLTDYQKRLARKELRETIAEVHSGGISGFRMKIAGIHAEAFGGNEGGRKSQMRRKGFTIIRMRGQKMKRDVIETHVEALKGNKHTAVFPLSIIRELVRLLSPRNGLVIDPYIGSGTTAVASIMESRRYLGIDIDPAYCTDARKRAKEAGK